MRYKLLIRLADTEEELAAGDPADFAAMLAAYRRDHDVRASDWCGAEVYDNGQLVKRLAYNGAEIE